MKGPNNKKMGRPKKAPEERIKPKKQGRQLKFWMFRISVLPDFFTVNDIVPLESEDVIQRFKGKGICSYIFQCEAGGEADYLHYQGVVKFNNALRWEQVRDILPGAYWEPSNSKASEAYCSKLDTRIGGPWFFPYRYLGEDILPPRPGWEKELIDIITGPADRRAVYWFWEPRGGVGKTNMSKYLVFHHKATLVGGTSKDCLFAGLANTQQNKIFILDLARTRDGYVPYEGIEQLKNGLGFSAKYESVGYIGPPAHVIIFANFKPDESKLSQDRWRIRFIGNPNDIYVEDDNGLYIDI